MEEERKSNLFINLTALRVVYGLPTIVQRKVWHRLHKEVDAEPK